jgi:hypothetical protein
LRPRISASSAGADARRQPFTTSRRSSDSSI